MNSRQQALNTADTPVCVTITVADALVLARSVFEHTINYRSAMIYGQPRLVTDPAQRLAGLRTITEHVGPASGTTPASQTARNSRRSACWRFRWTRPR